MSVCECVCVYVSVCACLCVCVCVCVCVRAVSNIIFGDPELCMKYSRIILSFVVFSCVFFE